MLVTFPALQYLRSGTYPLESRLRFGGDPPRLGPRFAAGIGSDETTGQVQGRVLPWRLEGRNRGAAKPSDASDQSLYIATHLMISSTSADSSIRPTCSS